MSQIRKINRIPYTLLDSNGNGKHYPNGVINYENGKGSNWYLIRTNSTGTITSVTILYRPS